MSASAARVVAHAIHDIGLCINLTLEIRHGGAFSRDDPIPDPITGDDDDAYDQCKNELDKSGFHGARVTVTIKSMLLSFAYVETGRLAERANGAPCKTS
jgi:hypothetical protein